jgi:23S rRNA (uracil1939-C5)-methyltransferase
MGDNIELTIASMAYKGYGVARDKGQVIFIPFTLPGERVRVAITEVRKDYAFGRCDEIIEPSASRVSPPCPYFGVCGGCQWQHIGAPFQAELKRGILVETLGRLGRLASLPPVSVIPAPSPYGYRIRVRLKAEEGRIGYHRERSNALVEIEQCLIAHPLVNRILAGLRDSVLLSGFSGEAAITVSPDEGKGVLLLRSPALELRDLSPARSLLRRMPDLKGLAIASGGKPVSFGEPFLHFSLRPEMEGKEAPLRFRVSPESFIQINPEQNRALVRTVLDDGAVREGEKVFDLYAGIGNFSLPLAARGAVVFGIEESGGAVREARWNAEENGLGRCRFVRGKVEEVLRSEQPEGTGLVVLDPPRAGSREALEAIARLRAGRMVYVSCDPATLARDLRFFTDRGFRIERLTLLDLFPQTYHMETVALLRGPC